MACDKDELKHVPLFTLLDDEELAVLASLVEKRKFAPRQRVYKIDELADRAYIMMSGSVRVTTVDEDHQEILVDEPGHGEFFGFGEMMDQVPHRPSAHATQESVCIEVGRDAMAILLRLKP